MFNVEAKKDLIVKLVSFIPSSTATYNVNLYTAYKPTAAEQRGNEIGGWQGIETDRSMWTQLINGTSFSGTSESFWLLLYPLLRL